MAVSALFGPRLPRHDGVVHCRLFSLIFLAGIASSRRARAHAFRGLSSVGTLPFSSRALLGVVLLRLRPAVALFVRSRLHGPVLTSAFMLRILFRAAALLYGLVWSRLG